MGVSAHIYVGAILKIGNINQQVEYKTNGCVHHGEMKHNFCPKCGLKTEPITCTKWQDKSIHSHNISTNLESLSNFDEQDLDGYVVLVPYGKNNGELVQSYSNVYKETPTIDTSDCIKQLVEKEKEYIDWLISEKFEVVPSFGIISYLS